MKKMSKVKIPPVIQEGFFILVFSKESTPQFYWGNFNVFSKIKSPSYKQGECIGEKETSKYNGSGLATALPKQGGIKQ